jgi:formylglycine-generating enzyme required for sulfatase activity
MGVLLLLPAVAFAAGTSPEQPAATGRVGPGAAPREFDDCGGASWCPRMVEVPGGQFLMGAPDDEPGRYPEEGPVRAVKVPRFAVAKYDVTRGQWAAFVAATNRPVPAGCSWTARATGMEPDPKGSWKDTGFEQTDAHPVVCVGWQDAQDYVRWLGARTGHRYRLLSEAEWEYAARAGTRTAYPWGSRADHEHANYGADKCCSGSASGRDAWAYTSPVGAFPPNAFGLHDMHGNVLQWVQDCFTPNYDASAPGAAPNEKSVKLALVGELAELSGTESCSYRMLRGGSWGDPPNQIRSAFRSFAPPPGSGGLRDYRSAGVGFRVARSLPN